jgi:hypothetical protein
VLFSVALGAWMQVIAGVFKRQLIPRWAELNGIDPELMPEITPEDVETPNLTEMASYITALAGAGMPLFPDENLSAHLRQIAGLPEASDEALAAHAQVQENEQQMAEAQLQQAQGDAKLAGKPQPVKKSLRERLVAKFSADQARSPKGSPTGGQWAVRGGADALSEKAMSSGDLEEHVAAGKAHRIAASPSRWPLSTRNKPSGMTTHHFPPTGEPRTHQIPRRTT